MIIARVDSVRDPVENDRCGSQNAKSCEDCNWQPDEREQVE
jgi:hypothetical protein